MKNDLISAMIVEDNREARLLLENYLAAYVDIRLVASAKTVDEATLAFLKHRPQLVFLDVELDDRTGFEFLDNIRDLTENLKVIFTTAYDHYAVNAIKHSAFDYLLKPVDPEELMETVNKVKQELSSVPNSQKLINFLESLNSNGKSSSKLVIPYNKGFVVVDTSDIIMCRADGYVTHFYLLGNNKICSTKNLKKFEEFFVQKQFIRVHRSYMVNLAHVKGYTHIGEILLADNLTCPLGDTYKQHFVEVLAK